MLLQCSYQGEVGYLVPFIWVDNDFTLMRGFIQGFPKTLGRIYMTKLHEMNPINRLLQTELTILLNVRGAYSAKKYARITQLILSAMLSDLFILRYRRKSV